MPRARLTRAWPPEVEVFKGRSQVEEVGKCLDMDRSPESF